MLRLYAATVTTSIGAAILGFALAGSPAHADATTTFTVEQQAPILAYIDIGVAGRSHADVLAFEAAFAGEGDTAGKLTGILITADVPTAPGDIHEDRIGQLVFDFGGGNSIVVAGVSVYADNETEMMPGEPQIRAVVGGTGQYIGARGQVTTVRKHDGTYAHAFELID
ncbi:hypothetical protein [Bauldia sp.]|uniref:hypothetical protein n=1 Tax=Bauldia sp. TaxID=2575872 RepID=UPI003BAD67DC